MVPEYTYTDRADMCSRRASLLEERRLLPKPNRGCFKNRQATIRGRGAGGFS